MPNDSTPAEHQILNEYIHPEHEPAYPEDGARSSMGRAIMRGVGRVALLVGGITAAVHGGPWLAEQYHDSASQDENALPAIEPLAPIPIPEAAPQYERRAYIVQPGDSLSSIAEQQLGGASEENVQTLIALNVVGLGGGGDDEPGEGIVEDPNMILPGQRLWLEPGAETAINAEGQLIAPEASISYEQLERFKGATVMVHTRIKEGYEQYGFNGFQSTGVYIGNGNFAIAAHAVPETIESESGEVFGTKDSETGDSIFTMEFVWPDGTKLDGAYTYSFYEQYYEAARRDGNSVHRHGLDIIVVGFEESIDAPAMELATQEDLQQLKRGDVLLSNSHRKGSDDPVEARVVVLDVMEGGVIKVLAGLDADAPLAFDAPGGSGGGYVGMGGSLAGKLVGIHVAGTNELQPIDAAVIQEYGIDPSIMTSDDGGTHEYRLQYILPASTITSLANSGVDS